MRIFCFFSALILLALPIGGQSANVILAWDPSPDPGLAGYNIYQGGASRAYTNLVNAGRATTVTIPNLIPGASYYFAATAYDTNGIESRYSAEVTYNVPVAVLPPVITGNPPATSTNNYGSIILLSASATGATNFHWYKNSTLALTNGGNLSGVLTTTLTISNASWLDNGIYSLQASNTAGAVFSSGETVYVGPPPPLNIRVTGP